MTVELYSTEAEQAVIGALMEDNRRWQLVGTKISPAMFWHSEHRAALEAIAKLAANGSAFDFISLSSVLGSEAVIYLSELARNTLSGYRVEFYAEIVADRYARRQVAAIGMTSHTIAVESETAAEAIAQVRTQLDGIGMVESGGAASVEETMTEWLRVMEERKERGGALQGIPTGIESLDRRWFGLCAPDLIIIAGRPSMGKTTLGMNIAEGAAAAGKSVLVFSLEMSASQLADRRVASLASVSLSAIRECNLNGDDDWNCVIDANDKIKQRKLMINDASAMSIDALRLSAAAHKARHGLDLVVVDYLGLLTKPGAENRLQEVRMISKGLKQLAKELHIPVIALSQLNRQSEARTNKRPMMADLRESGDIEQDADIVAFVHRQEKYEPENAQWRGVAEVITEKHRNGEVGTDYVSAQLRFARFVEMDGEFMPQQENKKALSIARGPL